MMCFYHAEGYGWPNLPIGTVAGYTSIWEKC